jgi:hypothetical protein
MKTELTTEQYSRNGGMAASGYKGMLESFIYYQFEYGSKKRAIAYFRQMIGVMDEYPHSPYIIDQLPDHRKKLQAMIDSISDECPDCNGTGENELSDCCGSDIKMGLCSDCKEHMEGSECESCDGLGYIIKEGVL